MRFDGNQPMTNAVAMLNRAAEFLGGAGRFARGLRKVGSEWDRFDRHANSLPHPLDRTGHRALSRMCVDTFIVTGF